MGFIEKSVISKKNLTTEQQNYFQGLLKIAVNDSQILVQALTHSSVGTKDNERLEFLGDRVLGLVIAEYLYHHRPTEQEGGLAKRLAHMASKDILASIAVKIGLHKIIFLSKSEENGGGRANTTILADCFEAVIAAVYLEYGFDVVRKLILACWDDHLCSGGAPPVDPKNILQEWSQANTLSLPEYRVISRTGPAHQPLFEVAVYIFGYQIVTGQGSSKKLAERHAAQNFLAQIGLVNDK